MANSKYKFFNRYHDEHTEHGINYRCAEFYRRHNGNMISRRAVVGFDSWVIENDAGNNEKWDSRVWYEIERSINSQGVATFTAIISLTGKHDVTLIDTTKAGLYSQIYEFVTSHYDKAVGE